MMATFIQVAAEIGAVISLLLMAALLWKCGDQQIGEALDALKPKPRKSQNDNHDRT